MWHYTSLVAMDKAFDVYRIISVTLILRDFEGVAHTNGSAARESDKEIHFSTRHIIGRHMFLFLFLTIMEFCNLMLSSASKARARDEILGVLVHEMVHCFQYNAKGTCPGGLIEGIAGTLVICILNCILISALLKILSACEAVLSHHTGNTLARPNGTLDMRVLPISWTMLKFVNISAVFFFLKLILAFPPCMHSKLLGMVPSWPLTKACVGLSILTVRYGLISLAIPSRIFLLHIVLLFSGVSPSFF